MAEVVAMQQYERWHPWEFRVVSAVVSSKMVNTDQTSPLMSSSYRKPVILAAIGFTALEIAAGAIVIRPFLLEEAVPEEASFVMLLTVLHCAIWALAAIGMFVWAYTAARKLLKLPQNAFRYSRIFSGYLAVCTSVLLLRAAWIVSQGRLEFWQTTQGALVMTGFIVQALAGLWSIGTAWLRLRGSGFGAPASVAAIVFLTLAFLPAGLIGVPLYLATRRHGGPVPEMTDGLRQS